MLANGQPAEEIRAKLDLPDDVVSAALAGWQEEARPLCEMNDEAIEHLVEQDIGGFIRLTMVRVAHEARREFSDQLLLELAEIPYSLVVDAMAEARRKVAFPERLVPFVWEFAEARVEKLRAEGERLERLAEIAGADQTR
jgi:hypothetical protein